MNGDRLHYREESIYDLHPPVDHDLSRLTLSHYGLSELDFGERRVSSFRYVLMAAGLLVIFVSPFRAGGVLVK